MRPSRTVVSIRSALAFGFVTLLAAVSTTAAAPVSPSEQVRYESGFSAVQKSTRTFQATLRQTLSLQGTPPIISTGTIYFQAPDRLLLRFSQPAGEWLLINGTQMAIQKKGRPLQKEDSATPITRHSHAANLLDFFSSGSERWYKDFDVTLTREDDHLLVHLKPWRTPTSTSQGVDRIVTTLQLPSYEVLKIEVTVGSNTIAYQFSNVRRNISLATDLFTLSPTP